MSWLKDQWHRFKRWFVPGSFATISMEYCYDAYYAHAALNIVD